MQTLAKQYILLNMCKNINFEFLITLKYGNGSVQVKQLAG